MLARKLPLGAERREWFLLTTLPVENVGDAECILTWYGLHWRIEDYFRVLKTGCQGLQNRMAERLQRTAAIVIAWYAHLGRELPNLSPGLLFSDVELWVLAFFVKSCRMALPKSLGDAVFLVAHLGGYFKRKRNQSGLKVIWNGYAQLAARTHFQELENGG